MKTQIAVRLPDELVSYVDTLVDQGARSRAQVVERALRLYTQHLQGEADARILEESGDYDDFADLIDYASMVD